MSNDKYSASCMLTNQMQIQMLKQTYLIVGESPNSLVNYFH